MKTIHFTKKNTFIRGENQGEVFAKSIDAEGNIISSKPYKPNHAPGAFQFLTPRFDTKTKRYHVGMDQDELNELVKKMNLYNDEGIKIEEAPLNSNKAAFWQHPEVGVSVEKGQCSYDENTALGKFIDSWTSVDKRFKLSNDKNPLMDKIASHTVASSTENIYETNVDQSEEAMRRLYEMDNNRKISILKLMGVHVELGSDPQIIQKQLFRKITEEKFEYGPGGRRYLDIFMDNSDEETSKISLKLLIQESIERGIIRKMENGDYVFGTITLGGSMKDSIEFVLKPSNARVATELMSALKGKKSDDEKAYLDSLLDGSFESEASKVPEVKAESEEIPEVPEVKAEAEEATEVKAEEPKKGSVRKTGRKTGTDKK